MARQPNGATTQKSMVETAINELGWKAGPKELQPVIKEKFNVDLSTSMISNYKSVLKRELKKAAKGAKGKPGPKPRKALEFTDLQAVQTLVGKLGAEQVKKLVDVAAMFA